MLWDLPPAIQETVLGLGLDLGLGDARSWIVPHPALLSARPTESLELCCPRSPHGGWTLGAPEGARPACTTSPPGLPQERHVVLGVHRVAEDVALQGRHGLLQPEKQGVAGAQADLGRDGQR